MKKIPYTTKTKKTQFKLQATERELYENDTTGWCLHCGCTVEEVEPDARKYVHHDGCTLPKVYGLMELSLMDLVIIK